MTGYEKIGKLWWIRDRTTSIEPSATTYATLLIALKALTTAASTITSSGEVKSTTAGDRSVEFFAPSESGTSQADLGKFAGRLRDLYVESNAALISAGTGSPTDSEIWDEMKSRLMPVYEEGPSSFATVLL